MVTRYTVVSGIGDDSRESVSGGSITENVGEEEGRCGVVARTSCGGSEGLKVDESR